MNDDKPGLYANIHRKRRRIARQKAQGKKVERMRKPGSKGAPTAANFRRAAKTARKGPTFEEEIVMPGKKGKKKKGY